jgi:hypothetical protein
MEEKMLDVQFDIEAEFEEAVDIALAILLQFYDEVEVEDEIDLG